MWNMGRAGLIAPVFILALDCSPTTAPKAGGAAEPATLDAATVQPEQVAETPDAADATSSDVAILSTQPSKPLILSPPLLANVETLCGLLIGCDNLPVPVPTRDFGACVSAVWSELASPDGAKFSLTIRECGLASSTCEEFRACALRGAKTTQCEGKAMTAASPVGSCDVAGRAVRCWRGKVLSVRDCPRGGEQCATMKGDATCILGPCPPTEAAGKATCSGDGNRIMSCDGGKLVSINCGAFGLGCEVSPKGRPRCTATGAPTCKEGSARCEGALHVGCLSGREVRVDCSAAGLACSPQPASDNTSIGVCVRPPKAKVCTPESLKSECRGNSIRYCLGGQEQVTPCANVGLTRCVGGQGAAHCE